MAPLAALRSNDGGFVTSLSVLATLTNNGSFVSAAGAGGARNITGTIQNSGLFSNTGTTNYTGFFINTGSVSNTANFVHVSGNSTFAQRSGTLTTDDANADFTVFGPAAFEFGGAGAGETGGTITGTVVLSQCHPQNVPAPLGRETSASTRAPSRPV